MLCACAYIIIVVSTVIIDMSRGKKGNSKSAVDPAAENEIFDKEAVNDVSVYA